MGVGGPGESEVVRDGERPCIAHVSLWGWRRGKYRQTDREFDSHEPFLPVHAVGGREIQTDMDRKIDSLVTLLAVDGVEGRGRQKGGERLEKNYLLSTKY